MEERSNGGHAQIRFEKKSKHIGLNFWVPEKE
jgi:hypothetical protein